MNDAGRQALSRRTTAAMAVAGALLLVVANIAFWFDRYVVDEQRFVDRTAAQLDRPVVRQRIAEAVAEDLLGGQPRLQAIVGPTLENTLEALLATPAFATLYRTVAANLHEMMTTSRDVTVSIESPTVTALVAAALNGLSGTPIGDALANRLSTNAGATTIVLIPAGRPPPEQHFVAAAPWIVVIGWAGGVLLLAFTFWRTSDRPWAALWTGATLAIGALACLLLYVLRGPVSRRGSSAAGQAISRAAYDAITPPLRTQSLVLLVLGVALVLVALLLGAAGRRTPLSPEAAR